MRKPPFRIARAVAERLYDYATHAQRQKRHLNRAALLMDEISPNEVTEYFERLDRCDEDDDSERYDFSQ